MSESFSLVPHENFSCLTEAVLAEIPQSTGQPALFPMVVPSMGFRDYLQLKIAERRGVCMGIDFLMPRDFVQKALHIAGAACSPWEKDSLLWTLLPLIPAMQEDLGIKDALPRERFAIAVLLADQLDQYGHYRPEMIRRWAAGKPGLATGIPQEALQQEAWQRSLWQQLASILKSPHPALDLEMIRNDNPSLERLAKAFPRLMVLGTGTIDPLLVELLSLLKIAGCKISMQILLPSLDYLGDLWRNSPDLSLWKENSIDPEAIDFPSHHPLLRSMGRHAAGSFHLLGKLDEQYTNWPDATEEPPIPTTLLKTLQSDIRHQRPPTRSTFLQDPTVRLHSCFGLRREMETLRDEILRAFIEIPDLKPHEIHIVTPSLNTYAPVAMAVFEQGNVTLPLRPTEVVTGEIPAAPEMILFLLQMAHAEKFAASELLELLDLDATKTALGANEDSSCGEKLREFVRQSGLASGLDGGPNSWEFALDRLVAGRWYGTRLDTTYPGDTFVLPAGRNFGSDETLIENFLQWISEVRNSLREWSAPAPPKKWSARFATALETLLAEDEEAWQELRGPIEFLAARNCEELLDAGTIMDWLAGEVGAGERRTSLSGKITIGHFRNLQNLPCRVLCIAGMQEGEFPARSRSPSWDLLRYDPRSWDRNPRVDDRQFFLDAILTPSERLILTASNRNVRTGKDEPFSACVDELVRVLVAMGASEEDLIVRNRLHPFASEYFTGTSLPHSFDAASARAANSFVSPDKPDGFPFVEQNSPETNLSQPLELSPESLVDFWKDPARAFLRHQNISVPREEDDDRNLDSLPLSLEGLHRWSVKFSILEELLKGTSSLPGIQAQFAADRGLPPGKLGSLSWKKCLDSCLPLAEEIQKHLGGRIGVHCHSAMYDLRGSLPVTKDSTHLIDYRIGNVSNAAHHLGPWIQAIAAAASGHPLPSLLFSGENPETPKTLRALEPEEAILLLEILTKGMWEGTNRPICYAPETSDICAKQLEKGELEEFVIARASEAWSDEGGSERKPGEGMKPAARIAWRDLDPFVRSDDWLQWAEAVAIPLRQWGKFK